MTEIMNIWAHRGCSQMYPENTLTSFEKAMKVPGLAGIELDVQLTRDGEIVVIHDERVDRTTEGFGFVRDYSLKELKALNIYNSRNKSEHIPTMREVFELLSPALKAYIESGGREGMRLNIELKTSVFNYHGIERKTIEMAEEFGVEEAIVYSSFYPESLYIVHNVDPAAKMGVLDDLLSNTLYKALGLQSMFDDLEAGSLALHPSGNRMDLPVQKIKGRCVRAWYSGHLYPTPPSGGRLDLDEAAAKGITDVFLNEPEKYLK